MTWEEVRDLDRANLVAILPVGAIEAHGPHLALSTDVVISEAMAEAGAARIARQGHEVLILPALCYTRAGFAAAFPGTISVRAETVTALLVDIASSLSTQDVPVLAIANSHLDPEHLDSIEAAVETARAQDLLAIVFPNLTRKPWALRLTDEFKSGACHAGQFETSVVLAAAPERVRDKIRLGLQANPSSLSEAIRDGKQTFAEAGGTRAYFGYPADASSAEGRQTIATLGEILAEAVAPELSKLRSGRGPTRETP